MLVEVSIAVNYILSHLYTKLPRRRVDSFGEELERYLHAKFQHHWFPNDPSRDAAFRCINSVGPQVDLLLPEAAAVSGLDWSEIQACLPEGLVISIDPGHVACQFQQPNYGPSDLNRFHSTQFWSPNSVSLSSSGCSSASSSISSTNITPTGGQVTQQVLYSMQDNWLASNGSHWPEGGNTSNQVAKQLKPEAEHGDHLATAAALSVLIDSEDNLGCTVGQDPKTLARTESSKPQNIWLNEPKHPDIYESTTSFQLRDTGFNSLESANGELSNGAELKSVTSNTPWCVAESETENTLLSMLHAELSGHPDPLSQAFLLGDKTLGTTRSASNPTQTEQQNFVNLHDFIPLSNNTNCIGPANQVFPTKVEQNALPPFGQVPHGFPPVFPQTFTTTAVSPFVQKSTSTPSFTAATFAQTKFGSTKLKSHSKRTPSRILSPTTVPPKFPSVNCNGGLPRESVVSSVLGVNHRPVQGMNADLSAFRQFMPLPTELNSVQAKQSHPSESLFVADCVNLKATDNGQLNVITTSAFEPNSTMNFGIQLQNCNSLPQVGCLDEFFSGPLEESSGDTLTEKPNTLENAQPSSMNTANIWPMSSMRLLRELNSGQTDNYLIGNDWIQSPFPSAVDCEKTNSALFVGRGLKTDDPLSLHDDASLSTRMVNLLLDEDNATAGIGHDPVKQQHPFGKSLFFDRPSESTTNGDQSAMKKILDNTTCFMSSFDTVQTEESLVVGSKHT